MARTKRKKRYKQFVPLIFALALILGLTLQKTSDNVELSEKCRKAVVEAADRLGIETEDVWWNTSGNFRKAAHVIEYYILGVCVGYAINRFLFSTLFCVGVSVFDQVLKSFIPVRHFDATDLVFDALGYMTGIVIVLLIIRIIRE